MDTKYFQCLDKVTSTREIPRGIELELDAVVPEYLRVEVLRDDVVRLKISRAGVFDEEPTFGVCADLTAFQPKYSVEDGAESVVVTTAQQRITIQKAPFQISAHRADGSVIFEPFVDKEGRAWTYATLNDEFVVRRKCKNEDAFYGLGEKTGRFNRNRRNYTLWNTDVLNPNIDGELMDPKGGEAARDPQSTVFDPYYISIPFFYHAPSGSTGMAGFFIDNGYLAHCQFDQADEYLLHFQGGQYTEYVIAGPRMPDILGAYTWLTGRMAAPPLWALGHHQCRWFAYTQDAVEALAKKHRDHEIPCDVLWLDIDYMDGYRVFTWNKDRFPDHGAMIERLKDAGFRLITIVDPGVKYERGYAVFDEAMKRDVLCKTEGGAIYQGQVWPGRTAFPDFVNPEGRKWWGELNAEHVRSGIAGIWNDMNEPATGDIPADAMRFGNGRYQHARYHNQYALLMAMGTVEGLLAAMPEKRTFVLSRAGSPGIQRYAANWMGDNVSRWDHLWMSIPMALGLGVSGQPFVGADIGGFVGNSNAELLVRWFQCGTLTPFCRNHNCAGQADQYPWVYGQTVEDLCREALELRYRLLPYIYTQFMISTETGNPVQRPLVFDYQEDLTTRDIDDQYLLGGHLLVAPIYKEGCTARQVYLPQGTWYHWHTGEKLHGRRFIVAQTPLEYIPLYARGGAVIPSWERAPQTTMGHRAESLELHVFIPDEDGETLSLLQEDDGESFAYQNGEFYRTEFLLRREANRLTLTATVTGDGYAAFPRTRFQLKFSGARMSNIRIDGLEVQTPSGNIDLPNTGHGFVLEAELLEG